MSIPRIDAASLCDIARLAGQRILQLREQNQIDPQRKDDGSPVTLADHASQQIILDGLALLTPAIPVVAEEQDHTEPRAYETYWLVDPLDGTRDFITGNNDFSINIGLIHHGEPHIGVIYAPARDDLFFGAVDQSFRVLAGETTDLMNPKPTTYPPRVVISLRDSKLIPPQSWIDNNLARDVAIKASAYKIALVAAGEADLFIRQSITSEWDTAAGDAILRAQGGRIVTPDGQPLAYNKTQRINGKLAAFRADFDTTRLPSFWYTSSTSKVGI